VWFVQISSPYDDCDGNVLYFEKKKCNYGVLVVIGGINKHPKKKVAGVKGHHNHLRHTAVLRILEEELSERWSLCRQPVKSSTPGRRSSVVVVFTVANDDGW
jgi:hypothetical protein